MQRAQEQQSHPSRVAVVYKAGAVRYLLPAGATLGDLAERMTHLDEQFGCAPMAIYLKLDRTTGTPTRH